MALVVTGLVGAILLFGWIVVSFAQRADRVNEAIDPLVWEGSPTTTWIVGAPSGEVPPPVVAPPADAGPATAEIAELYRRIFTPTESTELWEADFTDATGLREQMSGFSSGSCAPGTVAVVTGVQFTSDDTADVLFRFEGPNVPDIGRTYQFQGGAVRVPGGPWKATPDAVHQVVSLASGYCG